MAEITVPAAPEVEKQLLGAMSLSLTARAQVFDLITSGMFYRERHQVIFDAMKALTHAGKPVDLTLLTEYLERKKTLDACGGVAYLADMAASSGTSANAVYHARIVHERYVRRQLLMAGQQLVAKTQDLTEDIYDSADAFQEKVRQTTDVTGESSESIGEIARQTVDLYKQGKSAVRVFPTGLPEIRTDGRRSKLDGCLKGGLTSGRLFTLLAPQTAGKTSWLAQLAVNAAIVGQNRPQPTRISVLTIEDSPDAFVERAQAHAALLDPAWAQDIESESDEHRQVTLNRLNAGLTSLKDLPIQVGTLKQPTCERVCSWMLAQIYAHKTGLFIIDHFRAMSGPRGMSEAAGGNHMVAQLADFAKERDVCILIAHHINREPDRSTLGQHTNGSKIIRRYSYSDIGVTSAFEVLSFGVFYLMNPWAVEPPSVRSTMRLSKAEPWPKDMAILGAMKGKNVPRFELFLKWTPKHAMFTDWQKPDGEAPTPDYYADPPDDDDDDDDSPF